MRRAACIAIFVIAMLVAGSGTASSSVRDSPTLVFDVSIVSHWASWTCPPGSSVGTECFHYSATKIVPGLGRTSLAWNLTLDRTGSSCAIWKVLDGSWTTPKGTIPFSGTNEGCPSVNEGAGATVQIMYVPGSSGASGTATADFGHVNPSASTELVRWSGTLAIPNVTFDTTPPKIAHIANKVVKIHKGHRGRAFYKVAANDAVDGLLKTKCRPRSGSLFPIGRTRVTCSATDTSGNTATTSFHVIIKRRR